MLWRLDLATHSSQVSRLHAHAAHTHVKVHPDTLVLCNKPRNALPQLYHRYMQNDASRYDGKQAHRTSFYDAARHVAGFPAGCKSVGIGHPLYP